MEYVRNNHLKHNVTPLQQTALALCPLQHAFDPDVIADGFDIVIANPPYVRHEAINRGLKPPVKPQLSKEFGDFYCGTADLYTYFYKRGIDLLKSGGHLCFIAPKIVYPEVSAFAKFAIDDNAYFTDKTTFIITLDRKDYPYVVALANSSLIAFFHRNLGSIMRGGYYMNSKIYMEQLPVFPATDKEKAPIIERVQKILANPDSPDVPRLEAEINKLVYALYGLTPEEIAIVEGKIKKE
jgi:hypothetical protein